MRIILISAVTSLVVTIIAYVMFTSRQFGLHSFVTLLLPGFAIGFTLGWFGKKPTFAQWIGFIVLCTVTYLIPYLLREFTASHVGYCISLMIVSLTILILFHRLLSKFNRFWLTLSLAAVAGLIASLPGIYADLYVSRMFSLNNDPDFTMFMLTHAAYPLLHIGLSVLIHIDGATGHADD